MHVVMRDNPDVYFILLGLGYPRLAEFLSEYPDRAFNFEASEPSGLDAAVGMAYAGKIPIVYSITPFLLYRPFETWRTYINHENLHVIGIGAGRDDDYSKEDGFSHDAQDDAKIMESLTNIDCYWPQSKEALIENINRAIKNDNPSYINIKR